MSAVPPPSGSPPDLRFPRGRRLLKKSEFDKVFQEGRKCVRPSFVVYILQQAAPDAAPSPANAEPQAALPPARLGLAISRKVGKATVRNKARRRIREIFRLAGDALPLGTDLVVVARPGIHERPYAALREEFLGALEKLARGGGTKRPRPSDAPLESPPGEGAPN